MGSTILVADDDRAIRTVLNQALVRLGHEVRMTGNAATLWRWVADGDGDLVITDVIMPDENGLDLIPRIKKLRPELRVIVMSAQSTLLTAVKLPSGAPSSICPNRSICASWSPWSSALWPLRTYAGGDRDPG